MPRAKMCALHSMGAPAGQTYAPITLPRFQRCLLGPAQQTRLAANQPLALENTRMRAPPYYADVGVRAWVDRGPRFRDIGPLTSSHTYWN